MSLSPIGSAVFELLSHKHTDRHHITLEYRYIISFYLYLSVSVSLCLTVSLSLSLSIYLYLPLTFLKLPDLPHQWYP